MKTILCVLGLLVSVANAEVIPLRDGSIDFDSMMMGDGPVSLVGRRFTFDGRATNARLNAVDCMWGCDTGETLDLGVVVNGLDLPGVVTYDGDLFPSVGNNLTYDGLELEIDGQMRVPGYTEGIETRTARARCKVTGGFYHGNPPLLLLEEEELVGSAIATVFFVRNEYGWAVRGITYDIRRR